jgi:hypothetical protein
MDPHPESGGVQQAIARVQKTLSRILEPHLGVAVERFSGLLEIFVVNGYSETPENLRHCLYVVARTEPTS